MRPPVPIISVIIPVFNHAHWVVEAVRSVLAQSFSDWELLIIDDASSDQSYALLQSLQQEFNDSRLQLFQHTENQGAAYTLNEAMQLAQGSYFAILNSDDIWHPDRLATLYAKAEQDKLDFVASAVQLQEEQPHTAEAQAWLDWYARMQRHYVQDQDFLTSLLRGNFLIGTSNFFFHRRVFEQLGGFSDLRYVHDYEYLLRLCRADFRLHCLWAFPGLKYRWHDSNTIREKPRLALHENIQLFIDYLPLMTEWLNQQRLAALHEHLSDLLAYHETEWRTEIHARLLTKEQELFPLIVDRDAWIKERDTLIQQQQQWLADRDAWIQERDTVISQQQQWIKDRDAWIQERDAVIRQLQDLSALQQSWITDRDHWIADRDHWLAERDGLIAVQQAQLTERDHWLADKEHYISCLIRERDALQQSRAYRLGRALLKPLRLSRDFLVRNKWRINHA